MATKTVYAWYYPETKPIVQRLWESNPHYWYEEAWTKRQETMHLPFIEGWRSWSGIDVNAQAFPYAYPCNGASEPIKDLLLPPGKLHVFEGEYEGYAAIAKARGMETVIHPRDVDTAKHAFGRHDQFWISNPSAIDGNHWPHLHTFLEAMLTRNPLVRMHLDATYVGATPMHVQMEPARFPNVQAVIFSLSKPFGTYYHRIGGCYSRNEIGTLWGNFWFKNIFSVHLGYELLRAYDRFALPRRYVPVQQQALRRVITQGLAPTDTRPSDVVLLANNTHGDAYYARTANQYRFCLTAHMHAIMENGENA